LSEDIEQLVAVRVDEVVALATTVVRDQDVSARVLELADAFGGGKSCKKESVWRSGGAGGLRARLLSSF
jgi:hypothetical protein